MQSTSLADLQARARSILVIRFRYLGDMVLLASVFRNLRLHFPNAHLAALADTAYTDALRNLPDVDEVIAFPREETRRGSLARRASASLHLLRDLRRRRFDMLIDLADGSTSRLLVRLLGAPVRVGYASASGQRRSPYNVVAPQFGPAASHFLDHLLEPLKALGVPIEAREPVLRARPADADSVRELLDRHGLKPRSFIAVHPGARLASRCWPPASYAQVIDTLASEQNLPAVLLGGTGERAMVEAIAVASATQPLDLAGKLSFGQLVALLQACRLFIGNDTGPMHVAAAAGAPVVALFGLQSPTLWGPIGDGRIVLRAPTPCDPCPFPDICKPPDPERTLCVQRITVPEVLAAARRQLAIAPRPVTS